MSALRSTLLPTLILAALAALGPFSVDTYLPGFWVIAQELRTTVPEMQQTLTAYLLPFALMTLWHGAISDAIGRLTAMRQGLLVFIGASIGCAWADSLFTLCLFRVVQGLSAGAAIVVARAIVRDLYSGITAQRVMAQLQMAFALAPAIAPMLGGVLLDVHWRMIFIFLALYAAAALTAAHFFLRESLTIEQRRPLNAQAIIHGYREVAADLSLWPIVIAASASFAGFFIYVMSAPVFLMRHLHLGSDQFGIMFVPTVCGMIIGSWLARQAAPRMRERALLSLCFLWMGLWAAINIAISIWPPADPRWHIAPLALYNIGMSMAAPTLTLAALDRHDRLRGTVSSILAFVQVMFSVFSAAVLGPWLWDSLLGLALGSSVFLVLAWICVLQCPLFSSSSATSP
jgi:DHA1 family bicyclomycin/chloramphenicol resistance-like MFS transporter